MSNHASVGVSRGCGSVRTPGGVYVECGLFASSDNTRILEHFLFDPPLAIPPGLDLVNKPQLWTDSATGLTHLLIWVGAEHYPYVADYIEETRRFGASRKLSPTLDFSRLTPGKSRMMLAHPRCLNTAWEDMTLPFFCAQRSCRCRRCVDLEERVRQYHDLTGPRIGAVSFQTSAHPSSVPAGVTVTEVHPLTDTLTLTETITIARHMGPCLTKCYDLIPADAGRHSPWNQAIMAEEQPGGVTLPLYERQIGDTLYVYTPTGEPTQGLTPGVFAALPITGFSLIKRANGTVQEHAKQVLDQTGYPIQETRE